MTRITFIPLLCIVILVLQHYLFKTILISCFYVQKTIRNNSKQIKKAINFALFSALTLGIFSCNPSESVEEVTNEVAKQSVDISRKVIYAQEKGEVRLGKKLNDPYSVKNMQTALDRLLKEKGLRSFTLSATHLYIKFTPKTEEELDKLKSYSDLILYDYPIDYEIIGEGAYSYTNPELKEEQPAEQYASVPINYDLPKEVDYEILEHLHIPDEYNQDGTLRSKTKVPEHLIEELVTTSLILTDNLDNEKVSSKKTPFETHQMMRSSWTPAGQIFFVENYNPGTGVVNRTSPLVGASVRARRWHITHRGLTDNNGRFSCDGTFKRDANYSIKWERQDFDLRSGAFAQAIYNGPKQSENWNLTISSGESRNYAIVHTAAQEYYYGNRFGLKSPPTNGFWNSRLKIKVSNNDDSFHCKDCRTFGAIPRLVIGNLGRTADQIYGTTIHEITHSSHWELRREEWNNNNTEQRLKESWAQGVEWLFTTRRYRGYNSAYVFQSDYQWRTPVENPVYTSLMVDLNDNFDQSINVTNAAGQLLPIDRVAGYTFL